MRVERSGMINQPIERVFEYVSTPENDPAWVPVSFRHEKISPGPLRVGSITEEDVEFLGRRMRLLWEVCHYEPPSALTARTVSGPLLATIHLLLEPHDSATELTLVVDAELPGVYKLMGPLMKWGVQRQFKTQLRTLKNLLESGTSENPSSTHSGE